MNNSKSLDLMSSDADSILRWRENGLTVSTETNNTTFNWQDWYQWYPTTTYYPVYHTLVDKPNAFEFAFKVISKMLEKKIIEKMTLKQFIESVNEIAKLV